MRIVINRSDAIGDTLLTLPMGKLLKMQFPNAHLIFIISPKCKDLFLCHPFVDEVWISDEKQTLARRCYELIKKFRCHRPDVYLHVGGGHLPSAVAWLLRVPHRGGLISKIPSFIFLNQGLRQPRSMVVMHEMEYNLNLLQSIGIKYNAKQWQELTKGLICLSHEERENSRQLLKVELEQQNMPSEKEYIVIHPGMTGHTLNWSSRNYGRLIVKIEDSFPGRFNFIVSCTQSDGPYLEGLKDHLSREEFGHIKSNVFFLDGGKLGLRHTINVIAGAKLFVGPSTGPTHLASILNIPLVAIYSPIKVQSAKRWGPLEREHEKLRIAVPDVVCGETFKCAGMTCPYFECMAKIEVDDVYQEVRDLLLGAEERIAIEKRG